jgi:hypothetical protein
MPAAIKQTVTIRTGGLVEVRSPELHEGDQAEVTVIVTERAGETPNAHTLGGDPGMPRAAASKELRILVGECSIPNWDGCGAVPITEPTVSMVSSFLAALPVGTPSPSIGAEPDGDVTLEWYSSTQRTLSVSVTAGGELHYAALFGPSKAYGTEQFSGDVPQVILNLIRRVDHP